MNFIANESAPGYCLDRTPVGRGNISGGQNPLFDRIKRPFETQYENKPGLRRGILAIACFGFFAGIALSLRAQPDMLRDIRWMPLLAIAVLPVPLTLLLNALEFMLAGRLIRQSTSLGRALEITVIGSAANLLPLPGAALVRLAALKSGGAPLRSGLSVTALLAVLSLGLGLAYSGIWAGIINMNAFAIVVVSGGAVILIVSWLVAHKLFTSPSAVLGLIGIRAALIALDATRTWLAFAVIAVPSSFGQASVLTVSTVLAAVVAIVPAGLGLREGIAAFMAPFVGLNAAAAFLATSVSRIVGLTVVMLLTAAIAFRSKLAGPYEKRI